MQFKTKTGLVDIPNEEVVAAAREIESDRESTLHTTARRVLELYSAQYMRANGDGGRVADAMKRMSYALEAVSTPRS